MQHIYKPKNQSQDTKEIPIVNDEIEITVRAMNNCREALTDVWRISNDNLTNSQKAFFCRECGKEFKFQTSLLRHNNKVHISKYQCPTCCKVFSRQSYLDVHTSKPGTSCFIQNN